MNSRSTNVLVFGRGSAGSRYAAIAEKLGFATEFYNRLDKEKLRGNYSHCVIASVNENHIKDLKLAIEETNVTRFLIEKPLACDMEELKFLSSIHAVGGGYRLCTGDQYFHSPTVRKIKDVVRRLKENGRVCIEINYSDKLENVTKGNALSYCLDGKTGGAMWTFSHAFYVLLMISDDFQIESVNSDSDKNAIGKSFDVCSEVLFKEREGVQSRVIASLAGGSLEFEVVVEGSGETHQFDLNAGKYVFCGKDMQFTDPVFFSSGNRMSLIEANTKNFLINDSLTDQFNISIEACKLILEAKKWLQG